MHDVGVDVRHQKVDSLAGMGEAVEDLHPSMVFYYERQIDKKAEKSFEKSDLNIVEASLRVGGPFWPKTKLAGEYRYGADLVIRTLGLGNGIRG